MECINLKLEYSGRFRIATEDSYQAETGSEINRNTDPWNWVIRGRNGHICPWGEETLAACIDGHRGLCYRLAREPWVISQQYGDDGINAVFHVDDFDKAAVYIKPYVKRQYTEEQLEQMRENARCNFGQDPMDAIKEEIQRDSQKPHGG